MDEQKRNLTLPVVHGDFLRVYYGRRLGVERASSVYRLVGVDRLFPAETLVHWLAYDAGGGHVGADRSLSCREFAFSDSAGVFARYLSFQHARALREFLIHRCPQKLDIGGIYNVDPSQRSTYTGMGDGFFCKERELVFDIDMDEYDDVRTCCSEGKVCHKDWAYMAAAMLVMDSSLREDFGFRHILWVYSGRRGIHCWVCDARARKLSDRERSAVADFLAVYKGQQKGRAKLSFTNRAHPSMERALQICSEIWVNRILPEQQLFESERHAETIYATLGDPKIRNSVSQMSLKNHEDINEQTWHCIEREIEKLTSKQDERRKAEELVQNRDRVILAHVYPRLDIMVSKTKNHLLKAPFCVHPKTGRICVPIPRETLWDFNPDKVPTVRELYDELNAQFHDHQTAVKEETALSPYLHYFQRFVADLQNAIRESTVPQ